MTTRISTIEVSLLFIMFVEASHQRHSNTYLKGLEICILRDNSLKADLTDMFDSRKEVMAEVTPYLVVDSG
jgi:hypothetical protein